MMKKVIVATVLMTASAATMAFGEAGQWSSGYAQGVSEYTVVVSEGNSLYVSCSDDNPVSMTLTVNGVEYGAGKQNSFDLVINGKTIPTPYLTDSMVGESNFNYLWGAIRKAKTLQAKTSDGKTLNLPVKGVAKAIPAKGTSCFAAISK